MANSFNALFVSGSRTLDFDGRWIPRTYVSLCSRISSRAAVGQYDLRDPKELLKLLTTMASHRVIHHANKQKAARRDIRRNNSDAVEDAALVRKEETPSQTVAVRELIEKFFHRLGAEDRAIAEQRRDGCTWDEIGADLKRSGESVRKQFERAVKAVSQELGVEDFD